MNEQTAWDIYFAGIASIRFHPANKDVDPHQEVEGAAQVADLMIKQRRQRCHGLEQQSAQSEDF